MAKKKKANKKNIKLQCVCPQGLPVAMTDLPESAIRSEHGSFIGTCRPAKNTNLLLQFVLITETFNKSILKSKGKLTRPQ